MSEKDRSGEANYVAQPAKEWTERLIQHGEADASMTTEVCAADAEAEAKDLLLVILKDHAERRSLHVDEFLAMLERQARGTAAEQETRLRQFRGLLDILIIVTQNQDLLTKLQQLEPEISTDE